MIWQGNGHLVLGFTVSTYILFQLSLLVSFGNLPITHSVLLLGIPAILAAIPIAFFGYSFNQRVSRILIDPRDGKKTYIKESHTFLWLPMHYWAPIIPAAVLIPQLFF